MKTVKVVVQAVKGAEYLYRYAPIYKVSKASANLICKALNDAKYKIDDSLIWKVIDRPDDAYVEIRKRGNKLYIYA